MTSAQTIIFAYSPLGRGLPTGKYTSPEDFEEGNLKAASRYSKENFPNVLKVVEEIKQVRAKNSASAGHVALAWLLAQGSHVIPIPGTRSVKYLNENLSSLDVKLSPEEVQDVREISERADSALGDRYPPAWIETAFVNTPLL